MTSGCTGSVSHWRLRVRQPDVHTHLAQHGALAGVKVKAHAVIFTSI